MKLNWMSSMISKNSLVILYTIIKGKRHAKKFKKLINKYLQHISAFSFPHLAVFLYAFAHPVSENEHKARNFQGRIAIFESIIEIMCKGVKV